MTGPGNEFPEQAANGGHLRASQADRERAIEVLKTAFVQERLTKDEFDLRVDQALASRTYAELIVVTSDLLVPPTAARPAATGPVSTPARTLAKAAARAGACMLAAFVIAGRPRAEHARLLRAAPRRPRPDELRVHDYDRRRRAAASAVAGPVSQHWGWPGVAVFAAILVAGAGLAWIAERFLSR